jgi:hypothetical protein
MTQKNITRDWPADPANDELAKLAEELQGAAPALSDDAHARVAGLMQAEIERTQSRQRWRNAALGWSLAAAVLIAIGAYAALRDDTPAQVDRPRAAAPVEDRVTVAVGETARPIVTEPSLIRIDDYRGLFSD